MPPPPTLGKLARALVNIPGGKMACLVRDEGGVWGVARGGGLLVWMSWWSVSKGTGQPPPRGTDKNPERLLGGGKGRRGAPLGRAGGWWGGPSGLACATLASVR